MDWNEEREGGTTRFTRSDGTVVVSVRETADTRWAVTLDRLEQAPEGPAYERETVATREAALEVAARWRSAHEP
ncbi:DUF7543 family protein [Halomarina ordinaria]|uniref:DUF2188 domain-containing protein n=1 Tax=Halomarina ordinaria TaxID=3033939 RepID=A0ABD5UEL4_9EURY|nr:hypothetical protein [Halomarina sp. PSRA2]